MWSDHNWLFFVEDNAWVYIERWWIKKVIVIEREAFYCFFSTGLLGFVPEMPAESCGEIKAGERGMAVSGRYWLEPQETNMKSKKFLVIKLLFFNHGQFKKK